MMDRFPGAGNKASSEQWTTDQSKGLWPCLRSLSLPRTAAGIDLLSGKKWHQSHFWHSVYGLVLGAMSSLFAVYWPLKIKSLIS